MPLPISELVRSVRCDRPQGKSLRIVPIVGLSNEEPAYQLLNAETLKQVQITEVSAGGSVPTLSVRNGLDTRLLLIDGQELVGAKQNRMLNTDVLVPAGRELPIPVSCVEQGRWHYLSKTFSPGKSASNLIRAKKMARVHAALRVERRHDAGQHEVWEDVADTLKVAACISPTSSLHDAYEKRDAEMAAFRRSFAMPAEAVGLAVFHGSHLRGIDVFDRASTLKSFYATLLDSYAMDWMHREADVSERPAAEDLSAINTVLASAAEAQWEQFPAVGEGVDHRLTRKGLCGSALVWEQKVVVHLQLFPQ